MNLLLDTHAFLWFIAGDARLKEEAKAHIKDTKNTVWLSVASLWEISIKTSLEKLSLAGPFTTLIPQQLRHNKIDTLSISFTHLATLQTLPFHHRDPFDRLIIVQAQSEGLTLVTKDADIMKYSVSTLAA